jgi:monoterpene epsilon-lactone hydrolase
MISATAGHPLPPYARRVDAPGGGWRRWLLHLSLRMTVRRMAIAAADIADLRRLQERLDHRFGGIDPEARRTPVDASGVTAEWIDVPGSRPDRVIFYLHGGAFMLRFPRTHAALVGRWCRALGARALMVDYRLAPEHPFPAAPDDCLAAYRWLLDQGVAPAEVAFGGDSAGGNLALVTLLRARAAGLPMPRCAVLLSPVVDFTLSSRSLLANERLDPMFTLRGMAAMRLQYARPEQFVDPSVSPLFGDFAGLPPLLFQVGEREMLLDESVRAAERADAAGVGVEVTIWERMAHVFQALPLAQKAAAADEVTGFIRRHAAWHG